jgi:hypothetical protein
VLSRERAYLREIGVSPGVKRALGYGAPIGVGRGEPNIE